MNGQAHNSGVTADPMGTPPRRQATGRRRSAVIGGRQVSGREWSALRERWQARLPQPCPRCTEPVQPWEVWDLDHVGDPVVFGGRSGVEAIVPAHMSCNRQAGRELSDAIRNAGIATLKQNAAIAKGIDAFPISGGGVDSRGSRPAIVPPDVPTDPVTPPPEDSYWNAAPWLAQFRDVPPNATWPRLMSGIHPDAVGSYGVDAIAWIRTEYGQELRWWQRLAITRILEHDAEGNLVWLEAIVSTARQVGKSILLSALSAWRMNAAYTFSEPQKVLHTGKELNVCRTVQAAARRWARPRGYRIIESNGKEEMISPEGGEWVIRSQRSVYGYTATLAVADEAWAIDPSHIEEGLEPTMAERDSAQMILFSTAHRRATSLVPLRRSSAFAEWAAPDGTLLLEWSAARDAAIDDEAAWRQASPHWSRSRERLIRKRIARIAQGVSEDPDEDDATEAFRSQFLNVWPVRALRPRGNAEPLIDRATWDHRRDDYASAPAGAALSVAIEDWYGMGAAGAACVALPDGRLLTWGGLFASRAEAYAWAAFTIGKRDGCTLLVGATMGEAEPAENVPEAAAVVLCNTTTSRGALPLVRSLIRSGRLAHSGDPDMTAQATTVRLIASPTGGLVFAHGDSVRPDLLKAMCWAVADTAEPVTETPDWFVF